MNLRLIPAPVAILSFLLLASSIRGQHDELPPQIQLGPATPHRFTTSTPQKITKTLQGITFDSDYENGSLVDVRETAANQFTCDLYSEPGELGTARYWFRFRMTGVAGRTIRLTLDHASNPRPFVRMGADGEWRRMTAIEAPSNTLIVLTFDAATTEAELAFFAPLGFEESQRRVNDLVRACDDATSQVIGHSFQGREIWMVTVTRRDSAPTEDKHRVWVHARAHSGEATSSWVLLGFLEQITANTAPGRHLRRHCVFHIVPMLNPDGVALGHTRWDSQGIDPERQWCNPHRIPEVAAIKERIDVLMAQSNPVEVALNLHSTVGNFTDTFFFKHVQPSVTARFEEIQQRFIESFRKATPLFDNRSAQTSQLPLIADCATDSRKFVESYFWHLGGENVMAMTHEGHYHKRITDGAYITHEDYRALGQALAWSLDDYFQLPPPVPEDFLWVIY